jgi:NAD(P)-dependent dehydrogenase (short-subunit alcohol dehydrogenase family)
MRTPQKELEVHSLENTICPALDVTSEASVQAAVAAVLQRFGKIDAVVNNAGYGLTGPFEGATEEQIRRQFDTNVFGLMNVMRAVLPHLRNQKSGVVVNVASMGGRLVFPLYSLYHATKWAVEGFTESLRFELEPLGIRVKIIEPGAISTDFYDRSNDSTLSRSPGEYQEEAAVAFKNMNRAGKDGTSPEKVAKAIFQAANDTSPRLRYAVGSDAKALLWLRRFISDSVFARLVRATVYRR